MMLTAEQRADMLAGEVAEMQRQGWRVVHMGSWSAQLVKPKRFSLFWAMAWLLCFGVGIVVYLLYYMAKRDQVLLLSVGDDGRLEMRKA